MSFCCFVLLLFDSVCSDLLWDTSDTINWLASDTSLPELITNSIQLYYDDHFIMFGGEIPYTGTNGRIYIGSTLGTSTPSPTAANEHIDIPNILTWTSNHSIDEGLVNKGWNSKPTISCQSQCHSTNSKGTFFVEGYVPTCSDDLFLYKFDQGALIYSDYVSFDRYNLTKFYYNETYHQLSGCNYSPLLHLPNYPCVATNPDNFADTQTVYIVLSTRIFVYNISSDEGYFSDTFTNQAEQCDYNDNGEWDCSWKTDLPIYDIIRPSCSFDITGKYIWITDDNTNLWRYAVDTRELIDVSAKTINRTTGQPIINGTLNKLMDPDVYWGDYVQPFFYYFYSERSRMIPLTDGFIMITGTSRDYILLPNVTGADESYAESKTAYIDVVCAGRYHDSNLDWYPLNTPLFMDYPSYDVVSFGGYQYYDVKWELSICKECNADGSDYTYTIPLYNGSLSKQIRQFAWLRDFSLVINFTEEVRFGDDNLLL